MNKHQGSAMVQQADTSLGQNMLGIPDYYLEQNSGNVTALDKWLTRKIQELINDAPISFVLWGREEIRPANTMPVAKLHINSRSAIIQLLINPEYRFGDLYCIKAIDVEGDLPMLLHHCYRGLRYGIHDSPDFRKG